VQDSKTMVEIRRIKLLGPRYAVRDQRGELAVWRGRLGSEGAVADIDGERYEARRDGRRRFALTAGSREVAAAERSGRSVCELPDELPVAVQTFLGFVAPALWNREAVAAGGASAGATASTGG
jgi:hypothetical protein